MFVGESQSMDIKNKLIFLLINDTIPFKFDKKI